MIALLRGEVAAIGLDHAVLVTSGVGRRVHATPGTLADLRHDAEVELFTTLVVREESLTLFGFATEDERDTFEVLQSVSGVGPRLALAMLAVHSPDDLRRAVAEEDLKALQRVPGIGQKSASRIVLELTGKMAAPSAPNARAAVVGSADTAGQDVVAALQGLGWNQKVAAETVAAVLESGAAPVTDAAAVLRAALRALGAQGR